MSSTTTQIGVPVQDVVPQVGFALSPEDLGNQVNAPAGRFLERSCAKVSRAACCIAAIAAGVAVAPAVFLIWDVVVPSASNFVPDVIGFGVICSVSVIACGVAAAAKILVPSRPIPPITDLPLSV